jgi:hypothetical protein
MLGFTNVRHRLTLWYAGVFGLMLLLFICGATVLEYWQLTRQLYHAEIQCCTRNTTTTLKIY